MPICQPLKHPPANSVPSIHHTHYNNTSHTPHCFTPKNTFFALRQYYVPPITPFLFISHLATALLYLCDRNRERMGPHCAGGNPKGGGGG